MSIYYKYTPDRSKLVVLSYVDDYEYWYTYEELGTWFFGYTWKDIPCELPGISTLV